MFNNMECENMYVDFGLNVNLIFLVKSLLIKTDKTLCSHGFPFIHGA